ncbi:hypothetical protein [Actinoplanes sp. L3-i22]|uniref:hypothetical protein n=1 Tax=Actinoplanes sp. L3-i22 TaxID=2836373 RepID=UPI001C774DE1|nr:hypothetical protein [Actinoplanes sp. L3-i22]BCY08687.1 hypothetical protein L3i22_037750 [Actinoplanes sp. L3-i22]
MATQTLTCTVLPRGAGRHGGLRFDVHVAPRLIPDGADATLGGQFPGFVDWPAVAARLSVSLTVSRTAPGEVDLLAAPGRRLSTPDSRVWTAMFTPQTPVRTPMRPEASSRLRVGSYPIRHVVHFLTQQWGQHGATCAQELPRYETLIDTPFRQLALTDGSPRRGSRVRDGHRRSLRERYLTNGGVITTNLEQLGDEDAIGRAFVQVDDFHSGVLTPLGEERPPHIARSPRRRSGAPAQQDRDFHDAVALTASHGPLQRLLGLVLEFETEPAAGLTAALTGPPHNDYRVTLTIAADALPAITLNLPTVVCLLGGGRFEAAGKGDGIGAGLLRFGADSYSVTCLDPDAGAKAAVQFATTLANAPVRRVSGGNARRESEDPATPAGFALPALRTGPMTVAKDNRAADLAGRLKTALELHAAWHAQASGRAAVDQELYAEDLMRGLRWDVRDGADGPWRSLMWRQGRYELHRLPGRHDIPVTDEAAVVTATTQGRRLDEQQVPHDVPGDHLITESMLSWSGWSLAVEPLTRPVGANNTVQDPADDIDPLCRFGTSFAVPPGCLPRLRFGHEYQFRARTVDLGNSGLAATEDDLGEPDTVTPAAAYLRYDPVEAPAVLPRQPAGPAEGPLYAVVHEDRSLASRHVVPPRTAQSMLEWHGELDRARGQAPDPRAWQMLNARDAADLADLRPRGADWYPQELLDPPYLVDVLARAALVRGLPGRTRETVVDLDGPFRIDLRRVPPGGSGWRARGRVLEVGLEPGDVYRLRISSRFDPDDLELMGVWSWMADWAKNNKIDLDALRRDACEGRLWTLTPARDLMLVHAVRTPLRAPAWAELRVHREPGATPVAVTSAMQISQKSTATLDVRAAWQMPVDAGPGTPGDPTAVQHFRNTAFSVKVTHPEGPAPDLARIPVNGAHQLPDHRYRRVAYTAVATSPFVEHFREEAIVRLSATAPARLPADTDPATLRVRDAVTGAVFAPAGSGATTAATADGDFLVDPDGRTLHRTAGGRIAEGARVVVSLVRGPLTAEGPATQVDVLNSAVPAPPRIRYVVPAFAWDDPVAGTSRRLGGGLRVYLERPWWSSGDGELLGVVIMSDSGASPAAALSPYVTNWGADPANTSGLITDGPILASFPLAAAKAAGVPDPGVAVPVDVAGHQVTFDKTRDLWYADIRITDHDDVELAAYLPFVRLALARYQPNSVPGCHLSSIVTADFIQLVSGRTASVAVHGDDYLITVSGYAALIGTERASRVCAFLERRTRVADPELGWAQVEPVVELTAVVAEADHVTWTGRLPCLDDEHRIVVQEYEPHTTGDTELRRVVYTDILS